MRPKRVDEPGSQTSSRDLLRRTVAGDREAADRLFARMLPHLRRWAHRRVPQWARGIVETADMVQDAVLQTLKNIGHFSPRHDGALLDYLRQALNNRVRDQFRYAARHSGAAELDEEIPDGARSPLDLVEEGEARERYTAALSRLRAADRYAIIARLELDYSYEQLALVLRKPSPEAARLSVRRALLRFAREMQNV